MMKKTLYTSLYLLITGLTSVNGVKIQNSLVNKCLSVPPNPGPGTPVGLLVVYFDSKLNLNMTYEK